jgi:hypothetical protein
MLAVLAVFPCSVAWGADLPQSILEQLSEAPYAVPVSEAVPPPVSGDPVPAEAFAIVPAEEPATVQRVSMDTSQSPAAMAAEVISACSGGGGCEVAVKALLAKYQTLSPLEQEYLLAVIAGIVSRLSPDDPLRVAIANAVKGAGISAGSFASALSRVGSPSPSSDRSVLIGQGAAGSES